MDRSNATSQLCSTFRQASDVRGGAFGLRYSQKRRDVSGNSQSAVWNLTFGPSHPSARFQTELDCKFPATEMDASIVSSIGRLIDRFAPLTHEHLVVFLFDQNGAFRREICLNGGTSGQIVGTYRPLISLALACEARSLLIAHNHPSGDLTPSPADICFTRNIQRICRPIEIDIIDHVIIGADSALSMRYLGLL